jgi:hypothetical protein
MPYNSVLHVSFHLNHHFFDKSLKLKYMSNMRCSVVVAVLLVVIGPADPTTINSAATTMLQQ